MLPEPEDPEGGGTADTGGDSGRLPELNANDLVNDNILGSGQDKIAYDQGDGTVALILREFESPASGTVDRISDEIDFLSSISSEIDGRPIAPEVNAIARNDNGDIVGYLTNKYEGKTLWDKVSRGEVASQSEIDALYTKIEEQLNVLHADGILHGDLRPENVIVNSDGDIQLIDFWPPGGSYTIVDENDLLERLKSRINFELRRQGVIE